MFSSESTPSLVAHWKAATHESLISLRYWTPLVMSVSMLGPEGFFFRCVFLKKEGSVFFVLARLLLLFFFASSSLLLSLLSSLVPN